MLYISRSIQLPVLITSLVIVSTVVKAKYHRERANYTNRHDSVKKQ